MRFRDTDMSDLDVKCFSETVGTVLPAGGAVIGWPTLHQCDWLSAQTEAGLQF